MISEYQKMVTADGADLNKIILALRTFYGGFVIFGFGGSGKTTLAELMVANCFEEESVPLADATVVSDALRSWFNPVFLDTAVTTGVISAAYATDWCRGIIADMQLQTFASITSFGAQYSMKALNDFKSRMKAVQGTALSTTVASQARDSSVGKQAVAGIPVYKESFAYGSLPSIDYIFTPILNLDGMMNSSLVLGVPCEGTDAGPFLVMTYKEFIVDLGRAPGRVNASELFDALDELESHEFDAIATAIHGHANLHPEQHETVDVNDIAGWFCAPIKTIANYSTGAIAYVDSKRQENDLRICMTNNGFQLRVPDATEFFDYHVYVNDITADQSASFRGSYIDEEAEFDSDLLTITSDESEAAADIGSQVDTLFEDAPDMLYNFLCQSGLVADYLKIRPMSLSSVHNAVLDLIEQVGVVSGPVLVFTEGKSESGYSAICSNSNVDSRGLTMKIELKGGRGFMEYHAPEVSLLTATTGALMLSHTVHLSTLDGTVSPDRIFTTETRKGGMDSGLLQNMLYLSNVALRVQARIIIECRDDFSPKEDDESISNSRKTLGANSIVAMHISGKEDNPRNLWVRIRSTDELEDTFLNVEDIEMPHYDDVISLRPEQVRVTFMERFKTLFVWK